MPISGFVDIHYVKRRRHLRLKLLYDGLQRMDDGACGIYSNCGSHIEFSHLNIKPETPICGKCEP